MPLRRPTLILLVGLALGLAFDRLFHPVALGLNAPLFVALVVAALALVLYFEKARPVTANLWLFVPLLFFAAMIAVRADAFLSFLNIVAVLLLLTFIAVYLLRESMAHDGLLSYAIAPFLASFMALMRGGQVTAGAVQQTAATVRTPRPRSFGPAVRGVLLATPVVLVFGMLLASADTIFSELIRRLVPDDLIELLGRLFSHGTIVLVVGFVLAGGLAYALWRDRKVDGSGLPRLNLGLRRFLGFTEAIIVIGAVDLLFLAFVIVQVPYLFGGRLNITPAGFTYAEYARRGFGELVGVSMLVLGLLLVLGEFAHRKPGMQSLAFDLGSTTMVALTVVMLISAFKRLLLYEVAYGFTEMRLYPHVFMVWLAVLLGWFLITLWFKPGRFAIGLFVVCIGFLATLDVINPGDLIVRRNVARAVVLNADSRSSGQPYNPTIDAQYLTTLSDDAVPALVANFQVFEPEAKKVIQKDLEQRHERLANYANTARWPAFHFSRRRAYRALELWQLTRS